jgi:hypothetical protein
LEVKDRPLASRGVLSIIDLYIFFLPKLHQNPRNMLIKIFLNKFAHSFSPIGYQTITTYTESHVQDKKISIIT